MIESFLIVRYIWAYYFCECYSDLSGPILCPVLGSITPLFMVKLVFNWDFEWKNVRPVPYVPKKRLGPTFYPIEQYFFIFSSKGSFSRETYLIGIFWFLQKMVYNPFVVENLAYWIDYCWILIEWLDKLLIINLLIWLYLNTSWVLVKNKLLTYDLKPQFNWSCLNNYSNSYWST